MKTITYTIADELGLHARPVGKIVKLAATFPGAVQIGTDKKMVDCKRIMGVMGLGLKQGESFSITFEGDGEEEMAEKVLRLMEEEKL